MDLSCSSKIKYRLCKVTLFLCEQTCQLTESHIDQADLQATNNTGTFIFFNNTNMHHSLQNLINKFVAETDRQLGVT